MYKEIIKWIKKHYGDITAIGAVLFLIVQAISLIKNVGTLNIMDYYNYWKGISVEIKLYMFTFLNMLLTIILFTNKNKKSK